MRILRTSFIKCVQRCVKGPVSLLKIMFTDTPDLDSNA